MLVKIETVYDEIETIQMNESDQEIKDMTNAGSSENSSALNLHR